MSNVIYEITLNNDSRVIPELAKFMADSAYKMGLSKAKANFLCFTLETALELRMAEISNDNSEIKLTVKDNGSYFKYTITDFGLPYVLTENQRSILMKGLVDKYMFEQLGKKGQRFSFAYKYEPKYIKEDTVKTESLLDEDFNIRRLNNDVDDVLKAVRCLYATYGYNYYHQHLYSVESFIRYMQSGRYTPIITENKHKQFVCYCALDENEWFKGIPEFSNLVTSPIARGKGLASNIFKQAEKVAEEMNYEGIHVSAVAYHPYTQIMCNKLNYTPCSIEFSINPADTQDYGDGTRRLDCVLGIKIFNKNKKHDLYINEECNELIDSIFKQEGLNYEIYNDYSQIESDTIFTYEIDTDTSNCFVKIDECGKDFEDKINTLINSEEVKAMDVLTINLNINHPSTIFGYNILRKYGFISVGCLPGSVNGDYMLLQKFKVNPDINKIVLEDNYKQLLNKIIKINNL